MQILDKSVVKDVPLDFHVFVAIFRFSSTTESASLPESCDWGTSPKKKSLYLWLTDLLYLQRPPRPWRTDLVFGDLYTFCN